MMMMSAELSEIHHIPYSCLTLESKMFIDSEKKFSSTKRETQPGKISIKTVYCLFFQHFITWKSIKRKIIVNKDCS